MSTIVHRETASSSPASCQLPHLTSHCLLEPLHLIGKLALETALIEPESVEPLSQLRLTLCEFALLGRASYTHVRMLSCCFGSLEIEVIGTARRWLHLWYPVRVELPCEAASKSSLSRAVSFCDAVAVGRDWDQKSCAVRAGRGGARARGRQVARLARASHAEHRALPTTSHLKRQNPPRLTPRASEEEAVASSTQQEPTIVAGQSVLHVGGEWIAATTNNVSSRAKPAMPPAACGLLVKRPGASGGRAYPAHAPGSCAHQVAPLGASP
eukprot:scaffold38118_cov32-Tisochrysis_lutea.AAC.7